MKNTFYRLSWAKSHTFGRKRGFPEVLLLFGLLLAVLSFSFPTLPLHADSRILYVAPIAQGSGDCSDWDNACTLRTALSNARSGDEIWVKSGVHYPGTGRADTFALKNGVAVYGGFAGNETRRDERDWQTHLTVLSGDIDHNDFTDSNGVVTDTASIVGDNAHHVVTAIEVDRMAVLDGFIITAGQANNYWPDYMGGGLYNESATPTLINLTFSGNTALTGGGIYNYGAPALINVIFSGNTAGQGGGVYSEGSPLLRDVVFSANAASISGGGMFNAGGSPSLVNVTFGNNQARNGGGMYNDGGAPRIVSATFSDNVAFAGGGMYNDWWSSPVLVDVTFHSNQATWGGGIESGWYSSPLLFNVAFYGNTATNSGGGMSNWYYSSPELVNVLFINNVASQGSGMVNGYNSNPKLVNVTFSGNTATSSAVIHNIESHPTLNNVILWGNTVASAQAIYNQDSSPAISFSDIQGCGGSGNRWNPECGIDRGGNIDVDPLFVNAAEGNLHLQVGSPAIDSGNNEALPPWATTDLDGYPRIVNGDNDSHAQVDMGAYEYPDITSPEVLSITRADPNPTHRTTLRFVITFSEDVINVDVNNLKLTTTGDLTGTHIIDINGVGMTRTVTINTGSGSGALRLDIPDNATVSDLAGNGLLNIPYTSGEIYHIRIATIYLPLIFRNHSP